MRKNRCCNQYIYTVCILLSILVSSSIFSCNAGNIRGNDNRAINNEDIGNNDQFEQPEQTFKHVVRLHSGVKDKVRQVHYSLPIGIQKQLDAKNFIMSRGADPRVQSVIKNLTSMQIDSVMQHIEQSIIDRLTNPYDKKKDTGMARNITDAIDAETDLIEKLLASLSALCTSVAGADAAAGSAKGSAADLKKLLSLMYRLENALRNANVNTAESRETSRKMRNFLSDLEKFIDFMKATEKTMIFTIHGVTTVTDATYKSIRSALLESLENYFNLQEINVKVSDATANPKSILFTYSVTLKTSNIQNEAISNKAKELTALSSKSRANLFSILKNKVLEKDPELKRDLSQMKVIATIKDIPPETEVDNFFPRAKSIGSEVELSYISDLKLRRNMKHDDIHHAGAFKPLSSDDLMKNLLSGTSMNDPDTLMAYASLICNFNRLSGITLANAKQKCADTRRRLTQLLRKEKGNSASNNINLLPSNNKVHIKAEQENEAELKQVEANEREASKKFEAEQEQSLKETKEISNDSLEVKEKEDVAHALELTEENMAKVHHELLNDVKNTQKQIQTYLELGNKEKAEQVRKLLKSLVAKVAAAEKKLLEIQKKNKAAQDMLQNQRAKLAQAKVRMQQLEMKEKADKEAMKQLEAKRQEKIKERLVERENLHKNILSLKRDTAAIEAQIQNGAGIPGSAQTFDSSDIDQQSYAKQKLEEIVKGFSNVVIAKMNAQPMPQPVPPSPPPLVATAAAPAKPNQINIVIGCGSGSNCKKNKGKNSDENQKPHRLASKQDLEEASKPEVVDKLVKDSMKSMVKEKQEDEVDRLERRRIELEHDEKIQENASKDVKNAILAKNEAEDKVALMKSQLNAQRKTNADNKADLESEVTTRNAQKQVLEDKEEHVKEMLDAAS